MAYPSLGCASLSAAERGSRLERAGSPPHGVLGPHGHHEAGHTAASLLGLYARSPYAAGQQALCGYGHHYPAEIHAFFPQLASPLDVKSGLGPGLVSCGPVQAAGLYGLYPGPVGSPIGGPGCFSPYSLGDPARPKNATRESTATLKAWLGEHRKNPYPTKGEKIMLAIVTRMTLTQVSTWFANARRRLKKETRGGDADDLETSASDDGCGGGRAGGAGLRDPERPLPGVWSRGDDDDEDDDDDPEIDLENSDGETVTPTPARQQAERRDAEARRLGVAPGDGDHGDPERGKPGGRGPGRGSPGASPARGTRREPADALPRPADKPKIWSLAETAAAPDAPRGPRAPPARRGLSAWEAARPPGPAFLSEAPGAAATADHRRAEFLRAATP